jgi:galactokinase
VAGRTAGQIADGFRTRFGTEPLLVRSPGRVNLIGEHTDYNEGFVLPAATDRAVVLALAPRADTGCRIISLDYGQEIRFDIQDLARSPLRWPDYLAGVIDQFARGGYPIRGFHCIFGGDVPIGAGMSSSAAVEGGLAFGLDALFGLKIDAVELARLVQRAENEFVGLDCGIMDPFVNLHGRENTVLKLDCRSLEFEYLPFERSDLRIVVADTMVRRELAASEYNVRRRQCEEGVAVLAGYAPSVRSLRDVGLGLLEEHRAELDPVVYRRCDYVIRENIRVEQASRDLREGDFRTFGERMYASHAGLRDDYEVSSPELDILVESASKAEGVLGARMMGAGFGGCAVALVEEGAVPGFRERVGRAYEAATGKIPNIHAVAVAAGTHIISG